MSLQIRRFSPEDLAGCVALLQSGHDPRFTTERFLWLHQSAPLGSSEIAVCQDDDRIVGIYSVIRKKVRLGDESFCGGRDVDPVVHPDYRGQRLFSKLLSFGLENFSGIDFFFNFANAVSAPGFRRHGWRNAGSLEDRVCQLGYQHPLSKEFVTWLGSGLWAPRRVAAGTREVTPAKVADLLDQMDETRGLPAPAALLWVERSPAYLRWRYLDTPLRRYRYFVHGPMDGPADRPEALAICRHDADSGRLFVLDVVDLGSGSRSGSRSTPTLRPWLPLWARLFPRNWVCVWSSVPAALRSHFISNPLRRGQGLPFLVREYPGKKVPDQLFRLDAWFLTHGDVEAQ